MSTARDRILARVRSGLGTRAGEVPDRPVRSPAPLARPVHDRVTDFRPRAVRHRGTTTMDRMPSTVRGSKVVSGLSMVSITRRT